MEMFSKNEFMANMKNNLQIRHKNKLSTYLPVPHIFILNTFNLSSGAYNSKKLIVLFSYLKSA